MTQTFQQLQTEISQILKENHQLKTALVQQEEQSIVATRKLLLTIIEELDELERDERNEMLSVLPENRIYSIPKNIYNLAKKALLKILEQYEVIEMREEMYYNLSDYVEVKETAISKRIDHKPQIIRKGYLYKGELFRKGMLR